MCPKDDWKIDCYVDADFCGVWGSEDPEDPVVAKYVALSTAMRDMLPLKYL